jgi:hypothetical protein
MNIVSADDVYKSLDRKTENNWTFDVEKVITDLPSITAIIKLYIQNRAMTGYGTDDTVDGAIEKALIKAHDIMFAPINMTINYNVPNPIEHINVNMKVKALDEGIEVKERYLETPVNEEAIAKINIDEVEKYTENQMNLMADRDEKLMSGEITFNDSLSYFDDEMPIGTKVVETVEEAIEEDPTDNECPIPGTTITNKQIKFINNFKEFNQIDNDEKFNYYVLTWATNNAVDDIKTKKELIMAGYDMLENFISWIKVMQPTLDNGLTSPIE